MTLSFYARQFLQNLTDEQREKVTPQVEVLDRTVSVSPSSAGVQAKNYTQDYQSLGFNLDMSYEITPNDEVEPFHQHAWAAYLAKATWLFTNPNWADPQLTYNDLLTCINTTFSRLEMK